MKILLAALAAALVLGTSPAEANDGPQDLTVSYSQWTAESGNEKFKVHMTDPVSGRINTAIDWKVTRPDGTTARQGTETYTWTSDYSQDFVLTVTPPKTVTFRVYYYYVGVPYEISAFSGTC